VKKYIIMTRYEMFDRIIRVAGNKTIARLTLILGFSAILGPRSIGAAQAPPSSAAEATAAAMKYVWSGKPTVMPGVATSTDVRLEVARDSTTPFLADSIDGRVAWRVNFPSIILDLDSCAIALRNRYPRDIEVWIDSISGTLLRIRSWPAGAPHKVSAQPSTKDAEGEMGSEVYLSIPSEPPQTTFMKALSEAYGGKLQAEYIEAIYVLYTSHIYPKPFPAWVVFSHDFPPIERGSTSMRSVIDARTGQLLFASTGPRLVPRRDRPTGQPPDSKGR
jgi:hypothetical protein